MGGGDAQAQQAAMMQMMSQNPQMMQQMGAMLASNPAMMESVMQSHPMLQNMPPEQRAATMQMVAQMMQSGMMSPGMMNPGMMPSGPQGFGAPQQPQVPAAERYASQLEQLRTMGFPNDSANLAALEMTGGNVEFAISRLLGD
jgi:ubiquilin